MESTLWPFQISSPFSSQVQLRSCFSSLPFTFHSKLLILVGVGVLDRHRSAVASYWWWHIFGPLILLCHMITRCGIWMQWLIPQTASDAGQLIIVCTWSNAFSRCSWVTSRLMRPWQMCRLRTYLPPISHCKGDDVVTFSVYALVLCTSAEIMENERVIYILITHPSSSTHSSMSIFRFLGHKW